MTRTDIDKLTSAWRERECVLREHNEYAADYRIAKSSMDDAWMRVRELHAKCCELEDKLGVERSLELKEAE